LFLAFKCQLNLFASQVVDNNSFILTSSYSNGALINEIPAWQAKWIWQEADGPANTWVCFRKSFMLDVVPETALAKIAVDSKYWLWINGQEVVLEGGLKRGPTPYDTYYDLVDLVDFLQEGKNVIAAQVWYFGKDGFSHHDSGKGGLLFECVMDDTVILSDSTWKMLVDTAYQKSTGAYSQPNVRLSESHVLYNAQKDIKGEWKAVDYDDSLWLTVVEKGLPPTAPWNTLWLRPIPQWKNYGLRDYEKLSLMNTSPLDPTPITLPYTTDRSSVLIADLPYNAQVTPYLEIETGNPKQIFIHGDTYYNSKDKGIVAGYLASPGISKYESPGWMNGHRMLYSIPVGVTVKALKYRETGYDTEMSGSFMSNDTFFNLLWQKAQRTLYVAMRDNFMDCPDRERALWWGDAVIHIGMSFYALDRKSDLLAKKSISNLMQWQREDDVLYAPVPSGNWNQELPAQMLASVGEYGFWNYFMHSGDTTTIVEAYPRVKKYLNMWTIGANGLLVYRSGGWDWSDWGENIDAEILQNAWYYLALKAAKGMAVLSDNANDTVFYNNRMLNMQNSFNDVFWNGTEYRAPAYAGLTDERANAMAVLAGFADVSKWENIRDVLTTQRNASPYMEKYVLETLFVMGFEKDAMARMKHPERYLSMVEDPGTTLYEYFENGGSNNHAWSGGPLTLLSKYCAGVAPLTPAFETYSVFPREGDLTFVRTLVPSVKGNIEVEIMKDTSLYSLKLISPDKTKALVGIPVSPYPDMKVISLKINDSIVWADNHFTSNDTTVRFTGLTDKYMVFEVQPGRYQFEAELNKQMVATVNQRESADVLSCRLTPNPASEYIQIRFEQADPSVTSISLYSLQGKLISSYKSSGPLFRIDVHNLMSGVYMLKMVNGQNSCFKSFIKQ